MRPERPRRWWRRPRVIAGAAVLALAIAAALLAPARGPRGLASGEPLAPPGVSHPLGTNDLGQDLLAEWMWGARASLVVAGLVALLSTSLSWAVGLMAGTRRWAEAPLMAVTDLLLALPSLPLYLLVVALVGPSQRQVILALGLLSWPAFARVVRSRVLTVRHAPYVEAARALGGGPAHVALRHILPATWYLLPAKLALTVRFALLAEATLAFLGLGDTSAPSWGTTLAWAFADPLLFARGAWTWWALPPAASIVLVVLATTWLATGLEAGWDGAGQAVPEPLDHAPAAASPGRAGGQRAATARGSMGSAALAGRH